VFPHEIQHTHHIPARGAGEELIEKCADEKKASGFDKRNMQVQHFQEKLPADDAEKLAGSSGDHCGK
jgi:hypothetical protein